MPSAAPGVKKPRQAAAATQKIGTWLCFQDPTDYFVIRINELREQRTRHEGLVGELEAKEARVGQAEKALQEAKDAVASHREMLRFQTATVERLEAELESMRLKELGAPPARYGPLAHCCKAFLRVSSGMELPRELGDSLTQMEKLVREAEATLGKDLPPLVQRPPAGVPVVMRFGTSTGGLPGGPREEGTRADVEMEVRGTKRGGSPGLGRREGELPGFRGADRMEEELTAPAGEPVVLGPPPGSAPLGTASPAAVPMAAAPVDPVAVAHDEVSRQMMARASPVTPGADGALASAVEGQEGGPPPGRGGVESPPPAADAGDADGGGLDPSELRRLEGDRIPPFDLEDGYVPTDVSAKEEAADQPGDAPERGRGRGRAGRRKYTRAASLATAVEKNLSRGMLWTGARRGGRGQSLAPAVLSGARGSGGGERPGGRQASLRRFMMARGDTSGGGSAPRSRSGGGSSYGSGL